MPKSEEKIVKIRIPIETQGKKVIISDVYVAENQLVEIDDILAIAISEDQVFEITSDKGGIINKLNLKRDLEIFDNFDALILESIPAEHPKQQAIMSERDRLYMNKIADYVANRLSADFQSVENKIERATRISRISQDRMESRLIAEIRKASHNKKPTVE
ncbi:hypothetical protein [Nitrospirillum bahiense]|uniref:hypothetical protein n=1 Tax=Nitrospirillum amazonense TaxID=28077 RepID=UPI0011A19ABF|nr:hypothetical protein [Nitrospirillum amazonense]